MTWAGLGGILIAAFTYSSATPYPGAAVALPVISTALIVAGGMARPMAGAEVLLRVPPFQWMGKLSYSLYLWHSQCPQVIGNFDVYQDPYHLTSSYADYLSPVLGIALGLVPANTGKG